MSIDVLGALPDVDPLLWSHGSSISWICISVASASPTMKERLESRVNFPLQSSSRQTLLKMVFIFVVICQMQGGASCCGCVNCGIQLLPLKEQKWTSLGYYHNAKTSSVVEPFFSCWFAIWGGFVFETKKMAMSNWVPQVQVIHYSLVFVYSIGIGTWFLFLTDLQLCKIDSEGKGSCKLMGYSCVVVKVNWGYMAWF
jgi:hypothetical protein